jgi:hypothetical protein
LKPGRELNRVDVVWKPSDDVRYARDFRPFAELESREAPFAIPLYAV